MEHAASNTYSSPTSPGSAPSDSLSTVLYQHADHLTSRVTTENDGDLSNVQGHYPYGESWYTDGTADPSVKRKFTSYRKETDSSLASGQINYAIARYHGARADATTCSLRCLILVHPFLIHLCVEYCQGTILI